MLPPQHPWASFSTPPPPPGPAAYDAVPKSTPIDPLALVAVILLFYTFCLGLGVGQRASRSRLLSQLSPSKAERPALATAQRAACSERHHQQRSSTASGNSGSSNPAAGPGALSLFTPRSLPWKMGRFTHFRSGDVATPPDSPTAAAAHHGRKRHGQRPHFHHHRDTDRNSATLDQQQDHHQPYRRLAPYGEAADTNDVDVNGDDGEVAAADGVAHPHHVWYVTRHDLDFFRSVVEQRGPGLHSRNGSGPQQHAGHYAAANGGAPSNGPHAAAGGAAAHRDAHAAGPWEHTMDKEAHNLLRYSSWRRYVRSGLTEYRSVTIVPDCSPLEYVDFSLDDNAR